MKKTVKKRSNTVKKRSRSTSMSRSTHTERKSKEQKEDADISEPMDVSSAPADASSQPGDFFSQPTDVSFSDADAFLLGLEPLSVPMTTYSPPPEGYYLEPMPPGTPSVSSFSIAADELLNQNRRVSVASADVAKLMHKFGKGRKRISYDPCTGAKGDAYIRERLNATLYELLVARNTAIENMTGSESLLRSTSETPFVDVQLTGNEAVDAFLLERTARNDDNEIGEVREEYSADELNDKNSAWQSSSAWRRGLIILLLALLFISLSHIAAFLFLMLSKEIAEHPYACKTKNCLGLSSWLLEGMDNTTNPCDDFYQFACGTYMRQHNRSDVNIENVSSSVGHAIPFEYSSNKGLGFFLHRVHDYPLNQILPFYQACIDQDERNRVGFRPFVNLLLELKLLYPIKGQYLDVSRTIIRIYKKVNRRIFIDIYSSRENFLIVNLAKPENELLTTSAPDYVTAMRRAFTLLKRELLITDDSEIDTIVFQVMVFEARVVQIQSQNTKLISGFPDQIHKYAKMPKVFHPNSLPDELGQFRFDSFVAELFEHQRDFKNVSVFFSYIHSILRQDERMYMRLMEELLNESSNYVLLRYFQWQLIKHFSMDLTSELYEIMKILYKFAGSTPDERCFRSLFSKLHVLAATRYSKELKDFPVLTKKVGNVVKKIRGTLIELSVLFPYAMADSFRETFANFIIAENPIVGFEPYLKTYYKGLHMTMTTHYENVLQALTIKARNDLMKFQNIPPYHLWPLGEFSVDGVVISQIQSSRESIKFLSVPLGAIQLPFMGNDLPVFDYAGFGYYIGATYMMRTALEHFFKIHIDERLTESPEASVRDQKQMEMEMLPRLDCIYNSLRQASSFLISNPEYRTDPTGKNSRTNSLAFVSALQLLVKTIKRPDVLSEFPKHQVLYGLEKYSPDQLFFLGFTRHLCSAPGESLKKIFASSGILSYAVQINAALRNSPFFSETWSCPSRRFMNPKEKCQFFPQTTTPEPQIENFY